ncbi:MAG: Gfo/Idh/MocA family oxidoreductase, partial [candidate division Zixibacteria bacterium]
MGKFHASKLAAESSVDFVGCTDVDLSKSAGLALEYNITDFADFESMHGQVDAVSIAVPTINHFDVASRFLEAGVAVLLEKPISHDIESAENLVTLSESKNVILQIGHSERFNPAFLAIQKGISD